MSIVEMTGGIGNWFVANRDWLQPVFQGIAALFALAVFFWDHWVHRKLRSEMAFIDTSTDANLIRSAAIRYRESLEWTRSINLRRVVLWLTSGLVFVSLLLSIFEILGKAA